MGSILESGSLEQGQLPTGGSAASTVKVMDTWVSQNVANKIWDITDCATYKASIRSQLTANGFTSGGADLNRIDSLIGYNTGTGLCGSPTGWRVIVPNKGNFLIGTSWTGTAYFQIDGAGTAIGSIISGGLSGGYFTVPLLAVNAVINWTQDNFPGAAAAITSAIGSINTIASAFFGTMGDPLDRVGGSFVYSH